MVSYIYFLSFLLMQDRYPGASIYSTEVFTALRMLEYPGALSQTQSFKLDSFYCLGMAQLSSMTLTKHDTYDPIRKIFRRNMSVPLSSRMTCNTDVFSYIQWFPMSYYGNKWQGGVNGHFYHVFNTVGCKFPRY